MIKSPLKPRRGEPPPVKLFPGDCGRAPDAPPQASDRDSTLGRRLPRWNCAARSMTSCDDESPNERQCRRGLTPFSAVVISILEFLHLRRKSGLLTRLLKTEL
jgi:hypothetical protein